MKKEKPFYSILLNIDELIGIVFIAFMVLLIFLQVIMRYFLNSPLYWVEELTIIASIWVVFLGAGVAVRRNLHIAIDFIPYTPKIKNIVDLFINILIVIFFVYLFIGSFYLLTDLWNVTTPALQIPTPIVMVSFPICAVTISFSYIKKIYCGFEQLFNKN